MKDLRRVSDKQFAMEMDQAIANVKSCRVPSKQDLEKVLRKYVPEEALPEANQDRVF